MLNGGGLPHHLIWRLGVGCPGDWAGPRRWGWGFPAASQVSLNKTSLSTACVIDIASIVYQNGCENTLHRLQFKRGLFSYFLNHVSSNLPHFIIDNQINSF